MRDGAVGRRVPEQQLAARTLPDGPRARRYIDQPPSLLLLLRGEPVSTPVTRIALVTGGGRGIGREIALALAREGCHVAVASRSPQSVEATAGAVRRLGVEAMPLALDVTDADAITHAMQEIRARLGPIDVLVNNAGIAESAPFAKTEPALWERHLPRVRGHRPRVEQRAEYRGQDGEIFRGGRRGDGAHQPRPPAHRPGGNRRGGGQAGPRRGDERGDDRAGRHIVPSDRAYELRRPR